MNITNKLGLPEPIVEACKYDDYDAGEADISVTSLVGPTMIRHLRSQHGGEISMDVSDMIYSLTGKAIHEVLRRANVSGIAEKRLFAEIDGKVISGQFDHLSLQSDKLSDYKETSVWSVIFGNDSWEPQLNVYDWLCAENDYNASQLEIVAFLRDHQKSKAKFDPNYPPFRVHVVPIQRWGRERTEQYIRSRLKAHFNEDPTCTDQERWKKDDVFAVMKKGRKSSLKNCTTMVEAHQVMAQKGGTHIDTRVGGYRRCEEYCYCAPFCPIFKP